MQSIPSPLSPPQPNQQPRPRIRKRRALDFNILRSSRPLNTHIIRQNNIRQHQFHLLRREKSSRTTVASVAEGEEIFARGDEHGLVVSSG